MSKRSASEPARSPRRSVPAQHRPAVSLQQPPHGRSAAGRPVCHVPGRRVRSGVDRLRRHGHQGAGQDAGRQAVRRQRSVHRPEPRQLLLRAGGHQLASRRDARSARRAASRWSRNWTRRGATWPHRPRGQQLDRYRADDLRAAANRDKLRSALDLRKESTADARAVRPHAVRPVVPGGAAAGRGGQPRRQRVLGRVWPGRQRLGHALQPLRRG